MTTIRVLHISDSHFTKTNKRKKDDVSMLQPLDEALDPLKHTIDLVVHSGDVSDDGSEENLSFAKNMFILDEVGIGTRDYPMPSLSWMLKESKLILIPGNHDRYRYEGREGATGSWKFLLNAPPGGKEFDKHFGGVGEWEGDPLVYYCFKSIPLEGKQKLGIIGADFSIPRENSQARFQWPGRGEVDPERMKQLDEITQKMIDDEDIVSVLWIVHFPPKIPSTFPVIDRLRFGLQGEQELVRKAVDLGVPLLFSGHIHQGNYGYDCKAGDSKIRVLCCPALFEKESFFISDISFCKNSGRFPEKVISTRFTFCEREFKYIKDTSIDNSF